MITTAGLFYQPEMHHEPTGSVYYLRVCAVTCQSCLLPYFGSCLMKSEPREARKHILRLSYRQLPLHPKTEERNHQLSIKSLLNEPHF